MKDGDRCKNIHIHQLIFYVSYLGKYEELRDSSVAFRGVYSNKKVNKPSNPAWKITFYLM